VSPSGRARSVRVRAQHHDGARPMGGVHGSGCPACWRTAPATNWPGAGFPGRLSPWS